MFRTADAMRERRNSGGEELQQCRGQPQHMSGSVPHRALMSSRHQFHRISQVAVSGDRAMVIAVEAHDLGGGGSVGQQHDSTGWFSGCFGVGDPLAIDPHRAVASG
jgi:hypothetical protein